MELTFTRNSAHNTEIVGPGVAYTVRLPGMFHRHTISRGDVTVAEIEWHNFAYSILRMGGVEMKLSDFIKRDGFWNCDKRKFMLEGDNYRWSVDAYFNLKLECNGTSVATVQRKMVKTTVLRVYPHAAQILDMVILTMIVMWKLNDDDEIARAAAGGSSTRLFYRNSVHLYERTIK